MLGNPAGIECSLHEAGSGYLSGWLRAYCLAWASHASPRVAMKVAPHELQRVRPESACASPSCLMDVSGLECTYGQGVADHVETDRLFPAETGWATEHSL